jgi:hypothetical protein
MTAASNTEEILAIVRESAFSLSRSLISTAFHSHPHQRPNVAAVLATPSG